jgi:isocitrate dehydrogenase (NAD+)
LPNLYGDIAAELGAGLIGGVGLAPGAHFGGSGGQELAVFEATHGTAPNMAGTNRADPLGVLLSAGMMLRHVGEGQAADAVEAAVAAVVLLGQDVTEDIRRPGDDRPAAGTSQVADAVIAEL